MRVALAIMATLALAQTAAAEDQKKSANKDPNRIICEKQEVLGSRVATKKVCMTAAEWEDRRREDREAIDKAQTNLRGPDGG